MGDLSRDGGVSAGGRYSGDAFACRHAGVGGQARGMRARVVGPSLNVRTDYRLIKREALEI